MGFFYTVEQVEESEVFKKFKEKNPKAELCAGFFILDFEQGANQNQIDYSSEGDIYTFILNNEIGFEKAERIEQGKEKTEKMEKLDKEVKIEVDDLQELVEKKMKENGINKIINKIIAILQKTHGKQVWNINCMLQGMEILQAKIDCQTGEFLNFEKRNMFDFIKKIK